MPEVLSYADAVRLLGGQRSRFVEVLDRLTGGALLAASVPVPALLGIFDAKAEFVRLGHDLLRDLSEKRSGLSRYGRTQRLEAAHAVIAVTAFFEVLAEAELPFRFADLKIDRGEQLALAGARPDDPRSVTTAFFATAAPVPGPGLPYPRLLKRLENYFALLSGRLDNFVTGLAAWERIDPPGRETFGAVLRGLPGRAVDRHRDLLTQLAADFPEVGFWVGLHEHEATRRELMAGLGELGRILDDISTGRLPDERRAALSRAYAARLDRPILESGDVPAELRVPTLGEAYVPPRYRIAALGQDTRASDEEWWSDRDVHEDLAGFLAGHLTSPGATRAPLLVLGQPGSGKSVLTRALAARLPAEDFLAVRVALREVPAAADIQEQIEQAVRIDTGERLDWPMLARSAGDALPVVLLDGFDELLQATGVSQTDYLLRVAAFQRREADQGRPVVVLVTTRTSVADRAQPPTGALALRLEPFDDARVACWLAAWNLANADRFPALGVEPLDPETVLRHRELAEQPLLLMMLALYDADGNALRAAGQLRQGELYERLLRSFARREVEKQRQGLRGRELDAAVENELRRLAVVAFAMFNRRAQWVTEEELEQDLGALFPGAPAVVDPHGRSALRAAETVLGRFFFIHRAQASPGDGRRLETYEFLHATFGEFLVARLTWQVVRDLVARDLASSMSFTGGPVDDDLLHALLSYAALSSRAPVLSFLGERMSALDADTREEWGAVLLRLFHEVNHAPLTGRRFDGYRPARLTVPARYAVHAANLLLLAVVTKGRVTGRELYPDEADPVYQWHAQALLWRSQLLTEEWTNLVDALRLDRVRDEKGRDVVLALDDGRFAPSLVDISWTYGQVPSSEPGAREKIYIPSGQDAAVLRRKAHFECGISTDVLQHAVEPWAIHLPDSLNSFFALQSGEWLSPANALLDVWLLPLRRSLPPEQRMVYQRRGETIASIARLPGPTATRNDYLLLLLDRMMTDPHVSPSVIVDVVNSVIFAQEARMSASVAASVLRCCLPALGQDRRADQTLADVVEKVALHTLPDSWRHRPYRTREAVAEAVVRLAALGVRRLPIAVTEVEHWVDGLVGRRPDLVAGLRALAAKEPTDR